MIAGIWPFTSFKNAEFMASEVPGVVVPEVLLARMSKAATKEHGARPWRFWAKWAQALSEANRPALLSR